jgi:cytochrome c oxidase subunit 4
MSHHIVPRTTYCIVFGLLLVLLLATVGAATLPLGPWSIVVALGIAVAKATLIVLFFMHVRYSGSLVQVFSVAGVVWLALLFLFTFSDYLTRHDVVPARDVRSAAVSPDVLAYRQCIGRDQADTPEGLSMGSPASFQSALPAS